jgi:hypothetical protein
MIRTSGAIGGSSRAISAPKHFDWDFVTHPVKVFAAGGRFYKTDFDARSKVAPGIWNGPQYWVAFNGSDSNAGTSSKAPLASAWKARQLAEADPAAANGYTINFVADPETGLIFLDHARSFNDPAASGAATVSSASNRPFALIAHGGRLIMGPTQQLFYASADSATNTWVNTVPSKDVAAIYNVAEVGPLGVQTRVPKITAGVTNDATARAAVGAAPGDAWAQASGSDKFYVRLGSGRIVSSSTVLIAQAAHALRLGSADVYLSGVELIGGSAGGGAIDAASEVNRTLVFEDVGAWGQGAGGGLAQSAFGIADMTGLAVFHRCYGYNSLGDIFSLRSSDTPLHALMIDCWGIDAGHAGANPIRYSNQIVAADDTVRLISLNTQGSYSAGGCVRGSGSSQHWDLGSIYAYDRGDEWLGPEGVTPSTAVRIEGSARYWGQEITVGGCAVSFHASSKDAQIGLRSPVDIGGRREGPGIVGDY